MNVGQSGIKPQRTVTTGKWGWPIYIKLEFLTNHAHQESHPHNLTVQFNINK